MKILLVEDTPEQIFNYKYAINDYHPNLEIVTARSFMDLQKKLLTQDYDTAIVDMNLSKWLHGGGFGVTDGKQVCDLIQRTKNFRNLKACLFLYSANDYVNLGDETPAYTVVEKFIGPDPIEKFQSKILKLMKDKFAIQPPVTLDAFEKLHSSQKNRHYKNILEKDKDQERFTIADDVLWASDVAGDQETEIVCKREDDNELEFLSVTSQYSRLEENMTKSRSLPVVYWNFKDPELLEPQREYFRKSDITDDTLNLFFSISFAHGLAHHMLGNADSKALLDLANKKDMIMLREIQCKMVDLMVQQGDKEPAIRRSLEIVSKQTKYELVEYFNCDLDSFDAKTDVANVRLTSRLNPNRHYNREFSYKRLLANGIKNKDMSFLYCIYDHADVVSGYFEAK